MFYVYLLKCWKYNNGFINGKPRYGNSFYCGHTKDFKIRLKQHISGKNKSTKRWKGNIKLGYLEKFKTRSDAMKREIEIKTFSRKEKIKLLNSELNFYIEE